jgi:hypothetical protein
MANVQAHAAVGAQAASQPITIPPPLFRSSQGEIAAHLLPAHFTTVAPKRRVHLSRSPGSGGGLGDRNQAGLVESNGWGSAEVGAVEVALLTKTHPGALLSSDDFGSSVERDGGGHPLWQPDMRTVLQEAGTTALTYAPVLLPSRRWPTQAPRAPYPRPAVKSAGPRRRSA